jgi:hypothetical protein
VKKKIENRKLSFFQVCEETSCLLDTGQLERNKWRNDENIIGLQRYSNKTIQFII